jgi:hypothetical protein
VEGGAYQLLAAASSTDIRLSAEVTIAGDGKETLLTDDYKYLTEYQKPGTPLRISDEQFHKLLAIHHHRMLWVDPIQRILH